MTGNSKENPAYPSEYRQAESPKKRQPITAHVLAAATILANH
jgi:hypothetical protein